MSLNSEDLSRFKVAEGYLTEAHQVVGATQYTLGYELYKMLDVALGLCKRICNELEVELEHSGAEVQITEWVDGELVGPLLKGEPVCPDGHFRDDPNDPQGGHCGDELCSYCNWCYGSLDDQDWAEYNDDSALEEVKPGEILDALLDPFESFLHDLGRESQ